MTSIKNHKNFKKDCQEIEQYLASLNGSEKEHVQRLYKKFLELADKIDASLFELTTNSLNYTLHQELKAQISKVKKELDIKVHEYKQMAR
jgi:lipid A disaccharide synthetase